MRTPGEREKPDADCDHQRPPLERKFQHRLVRKRCNARTTTVSISFTCWGSMSDASTGVTVKVAISAPANA